MKEFVFAQAAIAGGSLQRNELIEEIVGEAAIMSFLQHPRILHLYGCSLTSQVLSKPFWLPLCCTYRVFVVQPVWLSAWGRVEVYDLFRLLCVLSSVFCFPPEVICHSRVIGACPVTTDCIVAMT